MSTIKTVTVKRELKLDARTGDMCDPRWLAERNWEIYDLHESGMSYAEIARRKEMNAAAVRYICLSCYYRLKRHHDAYSDEFSNKECAVSDRDIVYWDSNKQEWVSFHPRYEGRRGIHYQDVETPLWMWQ